MTLSASPLYNSILRCDSALSPADISAWLLSLRGRPYVPGSGYDVGAVVRAVAGGRRYYCAGVNVENADMALSV
ncbi:MAG: hypothetical protein KKA05_00520, partial [Alphaproteobacteria bacterium]|nr:hypothetical protein [Alphaproteobacteria bacterium]